MTDMGVFWLGMIALNLYNVGKCGSMIPDFYRWKDRKAVVVLSLVVLVASAAMVYSTYRLTEVGS